MGKLISRFRRDKRGATAIEYGLIIAMISLAIVVGVGNFTNAVGTLWDGNSGRLLEGMNSH